MKLEKGRPGRTKTGLEIKMWTGAVEIVEEIFKSKSDRPW